MKTLKFALPTPFRPRLSRSRVARPGVPRPGVQPRGSGAARPLCLALLALGLAACDPFEFQWTPQPDTVLIHSLARPELNLESGFNFNFRVPVVVESPGATGQWDVALDTQGDELVFLPPGALGINSRARITALPGLAFNEVLEAPPDTAVYVSNRPLTVTRGTIYVVQTGELTGSFGQRCVYFAKLEPLVLDVAGGRLTFVYDANPVCNDPRLVPPS